MNSFEKSGESMMYQSHLLHKKVTNVFLTYPIIFSILVVFIFLSFTDTAVCARNSPGSTSGANLGNIPVNVTPEEKVEIS